MRISIELNDSPEGRPIPFDMLMQRLYDLAKLLTGGGIISDGGNIRDWNIDGRDEFSISAYRTTADGHVNINARVLPDGTFTKPPTLERTTTSSLVVGMATESPPKEQ